MSKDWEKFIEIRFTDGCIVGRYYNSEEEKIRWLFETGQTHPIKRIYDIKEREVKVPLSFKEGKGR